MIKPTAHGMGRSYGDVCLKMTVILTENYKKIIISI